MKINYTRILFYTPVLVGLLSINHACKSTSKVADKENGITGKVSPSETAVDTNIQEGYTEMVPGTAFSFEMASIPAGKFMMGSADSENLRKEDEGPQREVELDAYYMAKYELTWELFELFFKQNKELFVKL